MPCRTFRSFCSINMSAFMNFEPAAPLCGKALQANRGEFIGQDEMDERLEQILLLQKCVSAGPQLRPASF